MELQIPPSPTINRYTTPTEGLSLSYDIKAHEGEIRVQSPPADKAGQEGPGTKFIIQLPIV